jgi:hypothetical protein
MLKINKKYFLYFSFINFFNKVSSSDDININYKYQNEDYKLFIMISLLVLLISMIYAMNGGSPHEILQYLQYFNPEGYKNTENNNYYVAPQQTTPIINNIVIENKQPDINITNNNNNANSLTAN